MGHGHGVESGDWSPLAFWITASATRTSDERRRWTSLSACWRAREPSRSVADDDLIEVTLSDKVRVCILLDPPRSVPAKAL
eukprot:7391517-Prymnesium_polylepis.2